MIQKGGVEIIYPEESYQLIKLSFNVFNKLGFGYQEKYYQRAYGQELTEDGFIFQRERPVRIVYRGKIIGRYFIDFVIRGRIVVEFKESNSNASLINIRVISVNKFVDVKIICLTKSPSSALETWARL